MYQHGKRTKRVKNPKVMLQTALVLGAALIAVAFVLHRDLATSGDERSTVPIITEVTEEKEDTIKINEPLFTMELPSDWVLKNRFQHNNANYYEWAATKQGIDDRRLLLHIDVMPASYKITRMQPLVVSGNGFNLGNLSGHCISFAKDADAVRQSRGNAPVEAKWEDVLFMCDPIEANQTIGTGTAEGGIAAAIGKHSYFFYYEDHNIRPDDRILQNALRSFRAR